MNANQIINMIIRMVMRRGINAGINKGVDMMVKRKSKQVQDDAQDRPLTQDEKDMIREGKMTADKAKKNIRMMRRIGRF